MSKAESRRPTGSGSTEMPEAIHDAVQAAQAKKAFDVVVLDLRPTAAFTDYFVICSAQNAKQLAAIADAVETALARRGLKPSHVEGYGKAEWVLLDFFEFVVHVFTPETRNFYSLERLWGSADRIGVPESDER